MVQTSSSVNMSNGSVGHDASVMLLDPLTGNLKQANQSTMNSLHLKALCGKKKKSLFFSIKKQVHMVKMDEMGRIGIFCTVSFVLLTIMTQEN